MSFDDELTEEFETIMLTDENGDEAEFVIIDTLENEGESYILVVETAYIDDEDAEYMLLKKVEEEGEDVSYELIEDDDEFDQIAALFAEKSDEYDVEIEEY